MKILLTIAYDGTNYFGWQMQDNFVTVQEEIEKALSKLFNKAIEIRGASRTDRGVHALGQRGTFSVDTTIPMPNLPHALNNMLPRDIRIHKAQVVSQDFHPQYNAKNKTYRYKIYNAQFLDPVQNNYVWHIRSQLDLDKMQRAAQFIPGEHDFAAFCATGSSAKTTVRTVYDISVKKDFDNIISIEINGNGFLYNMVRIIAGTLVYIGNGKLTVADMPVIIQSKDRTLGGITAPPQGLTLVEIKY